MTQNLYTRPRLLVLEAGGRAARRQGHTIAPWALGQLKDAGVTIDHVMIEGRRDLTMALGFRGLGNPYGVVLIIGHGSAHQLELHRGENGTESITWGDLGIRLAPLRPHTIALVSCEAGGSTPCQSLFCTVPTVQAIVGSALKITDRQAQQVVRFAVARAKNWGAQIDPVVARVLSVADGLLHGGAVYLRTRTHFESASSDDRLWTDLSAWALRAGSIILHQVGRRPRRRRTSYVPRRRRTSYVPRSERARRRRRGPPRDWDASTSVLRSR